LDWGFWIYWGLFERELGFISWWGDVDSGAVTEAEIKERTKQFALQVLTLTAALPGTPEGFTLRRQWARSARSVGANYRSASRGRSRADFASKLAIAEEEADESGYWLELILAAGMLERSLVDPLLQEANELTAILAASVRTVKIQNRKPQIANHFPCSSHSTGFRTTLTSPG
jgi:four helix bundle protein